MSAMSTARVESPGGKISPLDRMEEERKRRAEIAASAAERYAHIHCESLCVALVTEDLISSRISTFI